MNTEYATVEPTREEVDAIAEPLVIEFGTTWCGWCRGAQPFISQALQERQDVRHLKIEDGPGQPLGRSFRVKLWPTLVFLNEGREIARVTRPKSAQEISDALAKI